MDVWNAEYGNEVAAIRTEMIVCLRDFVPMLEGFNHLVAQLDVYSAFNERCRNPSYCRPVFVDHDRAGVENDKNSIMYNSSNDDQIVYKLVDAFHPLLEFSGCIRNSIELRGNNVCVITGPNMGGKSTFVKQCALISIMAQIGCYVPAKICKIPIFDGIYTRIGSSDCISRGESTFMREMTDIARICNIATKKSLIIIDELGRGTSARDGLSIAMAVCKYLKKLGISFFTTHFPEICELDVVNKKVLFNEVMLYKLVDGKCDESYGLYVCRLAGFPEEVVECAEKLMKEWK
ncbi:DNA mismatch repair protein MutS [Dictyocoela roeselum]|nr:DNA mismatch repair protein MutS [Dictyocoela roeselum]